MLILRHNEKFQVRSLHFDKLGEIVSPSTISYICSGLTFIGSTCGDSQFIEIHNNKDWRSDDDDDTTMDNDDGYIELLEEYTNLGPIVDMVSVDLERQGQCQLVTCSGVGRDGSLRIIKNGIGIEEVAEIEMEGIQGLWGLKENSSSQFDKYLITSFISETRVLAMTEEGLEEMEMNGLNSMMRTIHCSNMDNDDFVQIGESEINLIDLSSSFNLKNEWKCDKNGYDGNIKINSCATNKKQLLCALSGGNLILLESINNELKCINRVKLEYEISCVSMSPTIMTSKYGAVGMWKDYSIRILSLPDFNIKLCAPTSTSTHIEVAARFGGDQGMLFQLNNSATESHRKLNLFNCSWISNHNGEDERLFFGGAYRIRVQNIRNIKTKENYGKFVKALYYFHCMINGTAIEKSNILASDVDIITELINHRLNVGGFRNGYDKYINELFESFINNQRQIILDLYQIYSHFSSMDGFILIAYADKTSLMYKIHENIFKLFRNMKELIIYATNESNFDFSPFRISVLHLMKTVKDFYKGSNLKIVIKGCEGDDWVKFAQEELRILRRLTNDLVMFESSFVENHGSHILIIHYPKSV